MQKNCLFGNFVEFYFFLFFAVWPSNFKFGYSVKKYLCRILNPVIFYYFVHLCNQLIIFTINRFLLTILHSWSPSLWSLNFISEFPERLWRRPVCFARTFIIWKQGRNEAPMTLISFKPRTRHRPQDECLNKWSWFPHQVAHSAVARFLLTSNVFIYNKRYFLVMIVFYFMRILWNRKWSLFSVVYVAQIFLRSCIVCFFSVYNLAQIVVLSLFTIELRI